MDINPDQEINQISQDEIDQLIGEPAKEQSKNTIPDSSDSGNVMSADEIAALLANTDSLENSKPVETKPAMPDLSDPGHVMSADEIAALLANL